MVLNFLLCGHTTHKHTHMDTGVIRMLLDLKLLVALHKPNLLLLILVLKLKLN